MVKIINPEESQYFAVSLLLATLKPMTSKPLLMLLLVLYASALHAQTDSVMYTRDFVFKDGIYVTYEDLKNNKPNLTPENFKQYNPDLDYLDNNFFEKQGFLGTKSRKLFYPDSSGIKEHFIDSLYGYVLKNHLYIIKPTDLGIVILRVFNLGTISHCFPKTTGNYNWAPPNDYPIETLDPRGKPPSSGARVTKEKQYLLRLKTKKIYDYDPDDFEKLLKKIDDDLYNEFSKFSRSKKKKMIFIYSNKVNEKHPIYFKN